MATQEELLQQILVELRRAGGTSPTDPANLEKKIQQSRELLEVDKELAKTAEQRRELEKAATTEQINLYKQLLATQAKGTPEYETTMEAIKGLTKDLQGLNKEVSAGAGKYELAANKLLMLDNSMVALAKHVPHTVSEFRDFGVALVKSVANGKLFLDLSKKLISNSIAFATAMDKETALFRARTGAGYEYNAVINAAGLEYLAYGIGARDAAEAAGALFQGFRDFTTLNKGEQKKIIETTAILNKFGVSSQTTADILNFATKSLYMNTTQAEALTREMATLAIQIGKPINEVAADFASAAPKLAFYGQEMIGVFRKLEMQSKATGLSVNDLLGLVGEKFDTFEGAGMAVGRLNAILRGPYLNSIDMLNATEAERLEMLQETMAASGTIFNDLNKFEQKAFASALGTDVDTLRKSLNGLDPEVQKQQMAQEELAQRAGAARDIMTKLKDAINGVVISLEPLITWISKGLDKFSQWTQAANGSQQALWTVAGVITAVGFGLSMLARRALGISGLSAAVHSLAAANFELAASQSAVNATGGPAGGMGKAGRLGGKMGLAGRLGGAGLIAAGGLMGTSWLAGRAESAGNKGVAQGTHLAGAMATGAGAGFMLGGPPGAAIGAALGAAVGMYKAAGIEDGIVQKENGKVKITPIHKGDEKITLGRSGGAIEMGLQESLSKVEKAIRESSNVNVVVKIGEKELTKEIVTALNSFTARTGPDAITPYPTTQGSYT